MFTRRTEAFRQSDLNLFLGHFLTMAVFFVVYLGSRYLIENAGFLLAIVLILVALMLMSVLILALLIGIFSILGELRFQLSSNGEINLSWIALSLVLLLLTAGSMVLLFSLTLDLANVAKSI